MRLKHTVLALGIAAAGAAFAAGALAATDPDSTPARMNQAARAVPTAVPHEDAELLSVLRSHAAVRSAPEEVREFAATPTPRRVYAPNPQLARAVAPPDGGTTASPWYVIPGDSSACLYVGEAGSCATLEEIRRGLLAVFAIDDPGPAPKIVDGEPVPVPPAAPTDRPRMRVLGVAPDGVTTVTADSADGAVTAPVRNNLYRLNGRGLTNIQLVGDDGTKTPLTFG